MLIRLTETVISGSRSASVTFLNSKYVCKNCLSKHS